ncbi:SH3 domain-binding protein 2 [Trichomycterus rosablanca]|uniref:SH3 domain-binding protein 2 n=1 Tax=Trichomycterus rosablanca TaxID=2290929 RepID=UPI002F357556
MVKTRLSQICAGEVRNGSGHGGDDQLDKDMEKQVTQHHYQAMIDKSLGLAKDSDGNVESPPLGSTANNLKPCEWDLANERSYVDLIPDVTSAASMFSEGMAGKGIRRQISKRNMAVAPISWPNPMRAIGAQNLLTMPGGVTMAGYLHKKGGSQFSLMKWPLRYIIVHKGCVYYFKTSTSATPQGAFSLNGYNRVMRASEETTSSNVFPFKIVHYSKRLRTWYFSAASEEERRKWMWFLRKEINHYNNKKDFLDLSECDSEESFYDPVERPLDVSDAPEDPNSEFVVQDEDSYSEDYLIPDGPPGRPKAPSYPPPPVPPNDKEIVVSNYVKGLPPPPPPIRTPPIPIHRQQTIPIPGPGIPLDNLKKGPPPQLPSPLKKPLLSPLPASSPERPKKLIITTLPAYDRKPPFPVTVNNQATLPICQDLEKKVVLKSGNKFSSQTSPGEKKLNPPPPLGYKPAPPNVPKPPLPGTKKPSLQRSSPDGQSFRSSVEENPLKQKGKSKNEDEDSDDDYENVQLPDSVFINTTETSFVEKLFKEMRNSPPDGLYCIRNSGTKTSKVIVVWDVSLNKARNYRIFEEEENVFLDTEVTFPSLAALVEYYHINPLPNHGSLCLQQPYGYTPPR